MATRRPAIRSKAPFFILAVVLSVSSLSVAQGSIPEDSNQDWVARYHPYYYNVANSLAMSRDGSSVYVTGSSGTLAYDAATGAQQWANGAVHNFYGSTIAVSSDGSQVYVAGFSGSADEYTTAAYSASTGVLQWVAINRGIRGTLVPLRGLNIRFT
jgi:hypothetical protein